MSAGKHYPRRRPSSWGDMHTHRCRRCAAFWSSNARPNVVITRFCPDCVPLISHPLTTDSPHIHTILAARRRMKAAR